MAALFIGLCSSAPMPAAGGVAVGLLWAYYECVFFDNRAAAAVLGLKRSDC